MECLRQGHQYNKKRTGKVHEGKKTIRFNLDLISRLHGGVLCKKKGVGVGWGRTLSKQGC